MIQLFKNIENYKTVQVKEKLRVESVTELAKALKLEVVPDRIESYDISHISGADTVASMIVLGDFELGTKPEYDAFKTSLSASYIGISVSDGITASAPEQE